MLDRKAERRPCVGGHTLENDAGRRLTSASPLNATHEIVTASTLFPGDAEEV